MYFSEFHMISHKMQRDFMACMQLCINIINSVSVRTLLSLYYLPQVLLFETWMLEYKLLICSALFYEHIFYNIFFKLSFTNILHENQTNISYPTLCFILFHTTK